MTAHLIADQEPLTPEAKPSDRTLTADLTERLRRHYVPDTERAGEQTGGLFVHEVGVNGRFGQSRRCDGVYVGFTSASGRIMVGHEVKVSRADWRRELEKVGKADYWADACHAWYIVAPSTDIVPVDELPDGWGLMVPGRAKRRLEVVVKARVKTDHSPPWDAVRSVMARGDTLQRQHDVEVAEKAYEKAHAAAQKRITQERERLAEQGAAADPEAVFRLQLLDRLEAELGVTVANWTGDLDRRGEQPRVRAEDLALALKLVDSWHDVSRRLLQTEYAVRALDEQRAQLLKVREHAVQLDDAINARRQALGEQLTIDAASDAS